MSDPTMLPVTAASVLSALDPFCGPVGFLNLIPESSLLSCGDTGWGDEIADGFFITLCLSVGTLPVGLILGFFIALGKLSESKALKLSANIYTTIFRGLPELLTIFMIYFGLQIGLRQLLLALGFEGTIEINAFVAGLIALSLVFSGFASEVLASAFQAIPKGQYEGGEALGLRRSTVLRKIIVPQLLRIALPGLGNLWMNLLKDTALISVIGLSDILRQTGIAARVTKEPFLFFGIACLLYLFLAMISSIGTNWLENRYRQVER
jgi:polar amino acid transport system permease protein